MEDGGSNNDKSEGGHYPPRSSWLKALAKRMIPSAGSVAMKAIDRKLKVLTSIMLRISVVLLFLFVAIYLYREVNDGSYHIQEFQVPRQISEMGYSGDVVARKIQNRVVEFVGIANRTWSQKELEEYSQSADRTQLQVEVAGIGFSPQVLVRSLKGTFGIPSKEISGEVTYAGKRLRLTLRVTGQKNAFVLDEEMVDQSEGDAMESLIVKSAQKVLEINNPLLLGILFTGDITTSEIKHNDSLGIKMFRLAIATKPEQAAHAYVWWARSIFDISGDSILASRKLAKALSIDPETALAYHYLAQMKFHNGDFVEGERLMKKALELDPTSHWSWRALGWRYKRGNGERDNEAIQCYRKAIELGLNNPNDEMDLAFLYYYNNKYDEALDLIESKENLGIRYDLPLKYLVLKNLNDSLQADIELDRLRVDSKDSRRLSDRFNRLAYELEERKNKWPDAFELANLAIQLDSTNAYPFTTKAELSGLAGDEQGFYNNLELAIRKGFDLSEIDEHDEPYHKYSGDQRYQLLREKHKIRQ